MVNSYTNFQFYPVAIHIYVCISIYTRKSLKDLIAIKNICQRCRFRLIRMYMEGKATNYKKTSSVPRHPLMDPPHWTLHKSK